MASSGAARPEDSTIRYGMLVMKAGTKHAASQSAGRVAMSPIACDVDPDGRVVREVGISLQGMEEGPYDLVLDVRDEVAAILADL